MAGKANSKSKSKSTRAAATEVKSAPLPGRTRGRSCLSAENSNVTAEVQTTMTTTTTSTSTTQHVDVQQSVQIMQTMLHGCLSSIVFQRSIFPPNSYETRYYINNSSQWTYKDYLSANQGVIKGDGTGGPILALKKGVSARVDRFLGLMETGIFDALQRGFLKSLHLSIYEKQPSDILESWTLTVQYMHVGPAGQRLPSSFDLKERRGAKITLSHVKLSLNDFVRKLTGLCLTLPALPEDKKIILEIGYTNDKPQDYFAPGFPHPVYDVTRFPSTDDWEKVTSDVALMCTGYHAASLRVSHLRSKNPSIKNSLPSGLKCTEKMGRLDDVMVDLLERAQAVSESRSKPKASKAVDLSSLSMQADDLDLPSKPEHVLPSGSGRGPPSTSSLVRDHRRSSTIERQEQQQIRDMLRAPVDISNTQATQPVLPDQHVSLGRKPASGITISQAKIDQADKERSARLPPRKEISKVLTAYEHLDQITMRCQCGHPGEEGHMMLCEFCESYQHLHCYGYVGKDDLRLPVTHVCYQCLLNGEEEHVRQLRDQAMHRRALWLLRDNASFADTKSFGRGLGCTDRETERLLKKFRALGLLASSLGGSKKRVQPIALNQSESAKALMQQMYFDPSFGIAHHLETAAAHDGEVGSMTAKSHKRPREEADAELPPSKRPLPYASSAPFIDGNELNTPKSSRTLQPILRQE
ncbi:DNA-binding protein [Cucurbitaria berberidis CBS 394.84]|uniref:DNA-binding protein n=1 Tax=Cucurbitaria berberidis CBS 394.84 TaxID=1168544 RepID=A0A9P4GHA8_9PLEO|nr:DNA-binding protein [Cucurbitaria berberidis CBS 394.84]KAF1845444.1 DNA-binding protein [Cucurbitaria berberidis CBS 394.84]